MNIGKRSAIVVALLLAQSGCSNTEKTVSTQVQPPLGFRATPVLTEGGWQFRDLNRDGQLNPYEDWRLSASQRAQDLVARMTLEEKAGAMMHPVLGKTTDQVTTQNISSLLSRDSKSPAELATLHNTLQEVAESTRLGIPLTISTDPRHQFSSMAGMSVDGKGFSRWPDPLGLGATGDPELVEQYARIVAQEYRAAGINMALSPQADLGTEPRWLRIGGTFGENARQVGQFVKAYTAGAQGSAQGLTPQGVAVVVKHFAGYGAAQDGWDAHAHYGRFSDHSSNRLDTHIAPFRPAFKAGVAGVMSAYSVLNAAGQPPVAGAFNKVLLTDILRDKERYDGLVLTDWNVTEDCVGVCLGQPHTGSREGMMGKPWGVEKLTPAERMVMAINAGVDQFGGESNAAPIVAAVRNGDLAEDRINRSVERIMAIKFRLGLFENPFTEPAQTLSVFGRQSTAEAAVAAQHRSMVLLKNRDSILPLPAKGQRLFLYRVDRKAAEKAGFTVVNDVKDADIALMRVSTPFQLGHTNYPFGRFQPEGDLDYKPDNPDLMAVERAAAHVPVILSAHLHRPSILTNIQSQAAAVIADFGVSDDVLMAVVMGKLAPGGRLPVELPSSMAEVRAQKSDLPHDTQHPLYPIGSGLSY